MKDKKIDREKGFSEDSKMKYKSGEEHLNMYPST